jgi:hypothetical protein
VGGIEVAVMTGNLPVEQNIFHLRASPYVIAEIPGYKITGRITFAPSADWTWKSLAFAGEESH